MRWKLLIGIVVWALMFEITGAGMYANWRAEFSRYDDWQSYHKRREDMSLMAFTSAIPICWIIAPFTTGFYEDGFAWNWLRSPR